MSSFASHNHMCDLSGFTVDQWGEVYPDIAEDNVTYTWAIEGHSEIQSQELTSYGHYRGNNPEHTEISAALGDDTLRAICWRESRWRQFDLTNSKPVRGGPNNDGSYDWGLMQINNATALQVWDWNANIARGKELYTQKNSAAKNYLNQHPPVTDQMILRETLKRYNGGSYYSWNDATKKWVAPAHDDYVDALLDLIAQKPWLNADGQAAIS